MKIVTILGARPQFIKAGSVSREVLCQAKAGKNIKEIIVHTGQHYDTNMSDIFFKEMQIPKPDYFLGVGGKTHGAMTGQMVEKVEEVLTKEQPDLVMVYGDTNSTLAGALAASKLHIKIAHIEAGLRSFNMRMPEEINRIITDRLSNLLFCPTRIAIKNLNNEAIDNWKNDARVFLSGDVMQDGAIFYRKLSKKPLAVVIDENFVLCTIHRAENTDNSERLSEIVLALNEIAKNKQVILPLHPRTRNVLEHNNYNTSNLTIIDPVGYLNMVWLINHCDLVITDSGGLQKEAFFFTKPCITLRDETEWVELVELGVNVLTGASKLEIMSAFQSYANIDMAHEASEIYGGGRASKRIVTEILNA